jgi:CelD/BcsL family acetyltransferase involved in cellulose biosynthesis
MTIRTLTSAEQLLGAREAWYELAAQRRSRAFTHPFWCIPWYLRLCKGRPFVITVTEGGALVALAPFFERPFPGLGLVRFLGHGLGAVSAPLVAIGREEVLCEIWSAALSGRRFLDLMEYDSTGSGVQALLSLDGRQHSVVKRDVCPVIRLGRSFESWLDGSDKELRRILRRAERALGASGAEYRVEVVTELDRLRSVLPEIVAVHDAAEAANPRQHLLADPWAAFTRDMFRAAADVGRLRLFVGRVDGRAVSFMVMLLGAGTMAMWLNRFDPAFAWISPGHLTLRAVVEHAIAEGLDEVDLLLGAPRYKRLWCKESYDTLTVHAASSSAAFRMGRMMLGADSLRRKARPPGQRLSVPSRRP